MTFREKAQDLFIPVGRRKSVASSQNANVPRISTAIRSTTTPGRSGVQTQARRPQSHERELRDAGEFRDAFSAEDRLIISTLRDDGGLAEIESRSHGSPIRIKEEKNRKHLRRLSGKIVPQTSPITNLTTRLKRALTDDRPGVSQGVESYPTEQALSSELQEHTVPNNASTHFALPAIEPVRPSHGKNERLRGDAKLSVPASGPADTLQDDEWNLTQNSVSDQTIRSHSRGSSQSSRDRSHPPPSFPGNFYERFPGAADNVAREQELHQEAQVKSSPKKSTRRYTISSVSVEENSSTTQAVPSLTNASKPIQHSRPTPLTPAPNFLENRVASQLVLAHRETSARNASHKRNLSDSPKKTISHSHSSSISRRHDFEFHGTVHYYADCPHSSPPATRPLNVQPHVESTRPSKQTLEPTVRSVITGSCFECDTAARRDEETRILIHFNGEVGRLEDDIVQINSDSEFPTSPITPKAERPFTPLDRPTGRTSDRSHQSPHSKANVPSTSTPAHGRVKNNAMVAGVSSLASPNSGLSRRAGPPTPSRDDEYTTSIASTRTQSLQLRIRSLLTRRDSEIRQVWKGYTARWGPGTLGVVRANTDTNVQRSASGAGHGRNVSRSRSTYSQRSGEGGSGPKTRSRASSLRNRSADRDEQGSSGAPSTPGRSTTVSTNNGGGRRGHYRGTSRESTFSSVSYTSRGTGVTFETSADTPEGRMRVDWVRQ